MRSSVSDMPLNTGDNSVNAIAAAIAHPSIEQMNHKSVSRQGKRLVMNDMYMKTNRFN